MMPPKRLTDSTLIGAAVIGMQIRAGHPCKAALTTSPVAPQRASTLEQFGILGQFKAPLEEEEDIHLQPTN